MMAQVTSLGDLIELLVPTFGLLDTRGESGGGVGAFSLINDIIEKKSTTSFSKEIGSASNFLIGIQLPGIHCISQPFIHLGADKAFSLDQ